MQEVRVVFCVLMAWAWFLVARAQEASLVNGVSAARIAARGIGQSLRRDGVTRWGVRYGIVKDGVAAGSFLIGIFETVEQARNAFADRLRTVSVAPSRTGSDLAGEVAVAWPRRILFVRENVLVELQSWGRRTFEQILSDARRIDRFLREDRTDVRRTEKVEIPVVRDIVPSGSGWRAVLLSDVPGSGSLVDCSGMDTCIDNAAVAFCFATDGCVLSRPFRCDFEKLKTKRAKASHNAR